MYARFKFRVMLWLVETQPWTASVILVSRPGCSKAVHYWSWAEAAMFACETRTQGLSPTSGWGLDELLVRASGFLNLPSSWGFLGPFNVHFLLRASWSFLEQVRGGGCWEAQSRAGIGVQKPGFQSPQYCLSLIMRTKNRTATAICASVSHLKKKDSRFLVDVNDKIWWPSLFDKWQLKYGLGVAEIHQRCMSEKISAWPQWGTY